MSFCKFRHAFTVHPWQPTEVRHPHHVSSAMASFFIDSLNFRFFLFFFLLATLSSFLIVNHSATPLPEVILLLDVSSSTKEGGASPTLKKGERCFNPVAFARLTSSQA